MKNEAQTEVDVRQLDDASRLVTVKKHGRKGACVEPPLPTANEAADAQVLQWVKDALTLVGGGPITFGGLLEFVAERENEVWMPVMRTSGDVLDILQQAVARGELEETWVKGKKDVFYKLPEPKAEVPTATETKAEDRPPLLDGSDRHPNWTTCVNCKQRHPKSFVSDRDWCGHCNKAWQEGFAWAEAAKSTSAAAQVIDHAMLRKLVNDSWDAYNLVDEMLRTGLYGRDYDDFVREAICARVREYLKGKK